MLFRSPADGAFERRVHRPDVLVRRRRRHGPRAPGARAGKASGGSDARGRVEAVGIETSRALRWVAGERCRSNQSQSGRTEPKRRLGAPREVGPANAWTQRDRRPPCRRSSPPTRTTPLELIRRVYTSTRHSRPTPRTTRNGPTHAAMSGKVGAYGTSSKTVPSPPPPSSPACASLTQSPTPCSPTPRSEKVQQQGPCLWRGPPLSKLDD